MVVYTQGTFDLFHIGHVNLLRKCREIAGYNGRVIVSLLSDPSIKSYKGHDPIIPFSDRAKILESCKYVDMILVSNIIDIKEQIAKFKVDIVVVGSDWAKKDLASHYKVESEWLSQFLLYVPYTERESSTKIKERIKNDSV